MTADTSRMRFFAPAAVAALLLLLPATVAAHAELVETSPADGATVEGTPDELVAVFNEALEADGSSLSIRNAAGDRLAVGRVDPADPTRLIIDPVPELAPGNYEMRWTASSDDGHLERDTWSFTVTAAATPPPTPTPEPSASPSASAAPSASPTSEPSEEVSASPSSPTTPPGDPAGSSGDVILPIVAGLAIVLIAAGILVSRRGRPSGPS